MVYLVIYLEISYLKNLKKVIDLQLDFTYVIILIRGDLSAK